MCGPRKHDCQPFCGPEGRFYCSNSVFPAARAVLLSMRASEDFGCAEKLSAAEQIKPDCCRTPAVVSILLTPLPVSCPSTTPHHYT